MPKIPVLIVGAGPSGLNLSLALARRNVHLFYVADVKISRGFDRDLYINFWEDILSLMFPVRSSGMQRLIGHKFRVGRAFIVGDAGHMNTGIGGVINLGWKLAHVLQDRADPSLLDSYDPERIGFARSLVSTTDRAFTGLVTEGLVGEFTRRIVAPLVFAVATRFNLSRHAMFRTASQTRIHYPDSPLSQSVAGDVHGGDRLPWVGAGGEDNFVPLQSLDWQAHVYGDVQRDLQIACRDLNLPLHRFAWSEGAKGGRD